MQEAVQAEIDISSFPDNSKYRPKYIPIEKMIKLREQGLSYSQCAAVLGCSKGAVVIRMQGQNVEVEEAEQFKSHEADHLNALRYRIVKNISDEEIEKAPLGTKAMVYGILFDKNRLLEGLSTANHAIIHADVLAIKALQSGDDD